MKSTGDILFKAMTTNDRETISGIVEGMYIIDYGIVSKVNSDDTIDVKHASKLVLASGEVVEPYTLTPSIEVLWPSSAGFSMRFSLAAGDRVLLVGLKSHVPTVDISAPSKPSLFYHYTQETMKAIPVCLHNDTASLVLEVDDGKMILKNQINSLKSVLDELLDALTTGWVSINCVVGAPVTPLPTTISAIEAVRVKLATLFKD